MSRGQELLDAVDGVKHQAGDVVDLIDAWGLGEHKASRGVRQSMLIAQQASEVAALFAHGELDRHEDDDGTRRGKFIITRTGQKFWPLDPRSDEVTALDIAWSLTFKCRWGGFPNTFYSVAEHSLNVGQIARTLAELDGFPDPQLAGFYATIHDGEEAYLPDIPRPVKASIKGWPKIAARVQAAVHEAFRLPPPPAEIADYVDAADDIALLLEARVLFSNCDGIWGDDTCRPQRDIPPWAALLPLMGGDFDKVRAAFQHRLTQIMRHTVEPQIQAESQPQSREAWRGESKSASAAVASTCMVCRENPAGAMGLCDGCAAG